MIKKELFREVAVNRLSSPEQLDSLLQVTTVKGWAALAGIILFLVTIGGWSVFGKLPTKLVGDQCILVNSGGVNILTTSVSGRLSDLAVEAGDVVTRGQIIGRLEQYDMLQKINANEAHLSEAALQYKQTLMLAQQGAKLREVTMAAQSNNLNDQLAANSQKMKLLNERIETQKSLYDQGLITKKTLIDSQLELTSTELEAETIRTQIKQLEVTRLDNKKQSDNEILQVKNQLEELQRNVAAMVRENKGSTSIVSPYAGKVVEVKAVEGQLVERGTPLLSVESDGADTNELEAYIYLPASDGKKINRGMKVEISPSTARREEFGFLPANISSVANFPSSDLGLMRVFGNEKIVQQLSGTHAPIQIRVSLKPSGSNFSHYEWSTRRGPQFLIQSGTMCSANITLSEQRPIEILIPILKKTIGFD
ncbi:NHLP bacteriocin system secretion protein [Solimicrobium silvestre]|uniref:NHLM bacteriocin system secretion protein n=1 Tax=Solimicrobium silvestre TaxID=2099400 RepID=A0A2S9GYK3_9BURK|nr:NHLP bacteriocin system secretion protein [Solimicrobium silvestre]PRC92799.1 NHLM bacteriocin system secretion protein [Solimicrobium silvestre]